MAVEQKKKKKNQEAPEVFYFFFLVRIFWSTPIQKKKKILNPKNVKNKQQAKQRCFWYEVKNLNSKQRERIRVGGTRENKSFLSLGDFYPDEALFDEVAVAVGKTKKASFFFFLFF